MLGTSDGCDDVRILEATGKGKTLWQKVIARKDSRPRWVLKEAVTSRIALLTTHQGLSPISGFFALPTSHVVEVFPALIYGGILATKSLAIQAASGNKLSTPQFCPVKRLDAVAAFDQHDPQCGQNIHELLYSTRTGLGYKIITWDETLLYRGVLVIF
ncbi:hypothetical protein CISG_04980 [Coccidioides immitis RMSCC 3703]|uniref:Uncharacterized protein n=2 Tax=Coccidioides immitis TaxID=5501 RepID=A0A0J8TPE5_COCIT|nr:hypothetical protein CIRG_00904 [Coccidioides immitis RMSCC 2394]KMU75577.1 hypothetical protein CISG_04980 [Coccidioides immitis RMSCC 3703]